MSKRIYGWNTDGFWKYFDDVADDYKLKENETFDSPLDQNGNLDPAVKRVNGVWQQPTAEDRAAFEAKMAKLYPNPTPSTPVGPSQEQQMINMLGKTQMTQGTQIDANKADINQMKQMINLLGKQQMNANK